MLAAREPNRPTIQVGNVAQFPISLLRYCRARQAKWSHHTAWQSPPIGATL